MKVKDIEFNDGKVTAYCQKILIKTINKEEYEYKRVKDATYIALIRFDRENKTVDVRLEAENKPTHYSIYIPSSIHISCEPTL